MFFVFRRKKEAFFKALLITGRKPILKFNLPPTFSKKFKIKETKFGALEWK